MRERETWDVAKDGQRCLDECAADLRTLAEEMNPITGDGYGHVSIDDEGVKLRERLLLTAEILDDIGRGLQ